MDTASQNAQGKARAAGNGCSLVKGRDVLLATKRRIHDGSKAPMFPRKGIEEPMSWQRAVGVNLKNLMLFN